MELTNLDYLFGAIILVSLFIGFTRGFIKEGVAVLIWIAAIVIPTMFSTKLAAYLNNIHGMSDASNPGISTIALVVSFILLFFAVMFGGFIIKTLFVPSGLMLGGFNRLLGSLFGAVRGCLIVLVIVFVGGFTSFAANPMYKNSYGVKITKPYIIHLEEVVNPALEKIKGNVNSLTDTVKEKFNQTSEGIKNAVGNMKK